MANTDIIDLDVALDEYLARQQAQRTADQAAQQSAATLRAQKLSDYGYAPTPEQDIQRTYWGGLGAGVGQENLQRQQAIRAGILADDPYFVQHDLPGADPLLKAEYTGVDLTKGAVTDVRDLINSLPRDVDIPDSAQRILQDKYSRDHGIPRTYDYNVRVEPNTQQLIFNDPLNDNRPSFIDPPGIDLQDMKEFAAPIIHEIAGGVSVGALGSLMAPGPGTMAGAVVGETLGTFVWRINNLTTLRDQGYIDADYPIYYQAMKEAGWTAMFAGGAVGAFGIIKRLLGARGGAPGLIDEDEFMAAYEKVENELGEVVTLNELGEKVTTMTTPQMMMRAGQEGVPIIRTPAEQLEAGLRIESTRGTEKYGANLREKYRLQQEQSADQIAAEFTERGMDAEQAGRHAAALTRAEEGKRFSSVAREALERQPALLEAEDAMNQLYQESDWLLRQITDEGVPPAEAGAQLRGVAQEAHDTLQNAINTKYDDVAEKLGFGQNVKPYDYAPLEDIAERNLKVIDEQAFPDREMRSRLVSLLNSIESAPSRQGARKTHNAFTGDLSEIRAARRYLYDHGRGGTNAAHTLKELEEGMEAIRRQAFERARHGDPQAALKELDEAEGMVRQLHEDFDGRLMQGLLNLEQGSAELYKQGNANAFKAVTGYLRGNLVRQQDGTYDVPEFLQKILLDPTNTQGLDALKNGLRNDFLTSVLKESPETGGLVVRNPQAYQTFMRNNDGVLKTFFTEDEMAEFASPEEFLRTFTRRKVALQNTIDTLRGGNLRHLADREGFQPEKLFEQTWRPGEVTPTKTLFDAVTEHGADDLISSYKAYIFKDFMDATQTKGLTGQSVFNARDMEKYIGEHGDAMRVWIGDKFVNNLSTMANRLKAFDDPGARQLTEKSLSVQQALNSMVRAYVGIFTTPGRVLTAVKHIYGGTASNRALRLLSNPDELYNVFRTNAWLRNPGLRGAVREIGRIFYREDAPALPVDVRPEETLMFGPGYQIPEEEPQEFNLGGHVVRNLRNVPLKYGYGE